MAANRRTAAGLGTALAFLAVLQRRRRRGGADPAHAPGHAHRGAAPDAAAPASESGTSHLHDQPWIRRSHSDSQQRRFRR